jgi:hypothetical protein
MTFELNNENFLMFAIKNYDNPSCKGMADFNNDLKKIKYIKRLLSRYNAGKGLKVRLILNHIIILINLFGPDACVKILFFKFEEKYWPQLKTFLIFLNALPTNIQINSKTNECDIPIDMVIANELRKI